MKRTILSLTAIAFAIGADAQVSFGGQAGANFASAKATYTGTPSSSQTLKTKVGFTIGALAEIGLGSGLIFRPELSFIQKGGKFSDTKTTNVGVGTVTTASTEDLSLGYIDLAPNFVYNFDAGTGKVFVGAGPDLAFGIGGKYKYTANTTSTITGYPSSSSSGDSKIKFDGKKEADLPATDNDYHLKGLDFGINVLAGYKLSNGAFISAGYTIGLSNIDPNDKQTFKNSGFNIKLGYIFGGSKDSKKED